MGGTLAFNTIINGSETFTKGLHDPLFLAHNITNFYCKSFIVEPNSQPMFVLNIKKEIFWNNNMTVGGEVI